jgi:mono/diheme cytochrome c family protein
MGLLLILALSGCSGSKSAEASAPSPPAESQAPADPAFVKGDAVRGKQVFMGTCATCHGQNARGDGVWAADLIASDLVKQQADDMLYQFVMNGHNPKVSDRPDLDPDKIKDAVAYVKTLGK